MTAKHLNLENQNIQRPSSKFAGDVWERTHRCRPLSKVTASKGNQNAFNQIFGLFSVVISFTFNIKNQDTFVIVKLFLNPLGTQV